MASSGHRNFQPEVCRPYVNKDAFWGNLLVRKVYKTYDFGTTNSDPIVKTGGSKTMGFFVHIGHESGYG